MKNLGWVFLAGVTATIGLASLGGTGESQGTLTHVPVRTFPILKVKNRDEIKVMIIDTGIGFNKKISPWIQRDGSGDYQDVLGHGTHIAGLVALGLSQEDSVCGQVKIYSCRYYESKAPGLENLDRSLQCFKRALEMGIDVINYSGGGPEASQSEYDAIKKFTDGGGILVTAAGNNHTKLARFSYYPATYGLYNGYKRPALDRIVVVQAKCEDGQICGFSNTDPGAVTEFGDSMRSTLPNNWSGLMRGTSQATALVTHKLLQLTCKKVNHVN